MDMFFILSAAVFVVLGLGVIGRPQPQRRAIRVPVQNKRR
ncbi:hypothetical protein SAMN04488032_10941 [Pacificibacter marinus]|jgi:hypothetical protein|uniref:NERD domain-containing protein n=1 Tax=Pacificibacter marinus TaxID=658057 RepID=A0A1Y5T6E5_9RHOB|nr:hypothetical protein SAMN04488032_10941 [Pacificibacter marinus]SLN53535.1 hypothetical protein PAM7971_02731 [Pacificibacter marinus]